MFTQFTRTKQTFGSLIGLHRRHCHTTLTQLPQSVATFHHHVRPWMMPVTLSDACVRQIMEHYQTRKMDPSEYKLRVKFNENPRIPQLIQYFFTENAQVNAEEDVVIERDGASVVIDKKSLHKFEESKLEVLDYEFDEDNVARSTYTVRAQRAW